MCIVFTRFLHPGVTDKGNYTMFDMVRPLVPVNGPPLYPPMEYRIPYEKPLPVGAPYQGVRKEETPVFESAWERGLRQAKELMRKSTKRKETDMDFEEKKMNLSLGQEELDKENDYYTRPASPVVKEDSERWSSYDRLKGGEAEPKYARENSVLGDRYDDFGAESPYYHHPVRDYWPPRRVHYEPGDSRPIRVEAEYVGNRTGKYQRQHRTSPAEYYEKVEKKKKSQPTREVIVQRVEKPWRDESRYTEVSATSHKGRGDEWADPWMRSKSPTGRKAGGRPTRKQSYSTGSSYSSSRVTSGTSGHLSRQEFLPFLSQAVTLMVCTNVLLTNFIPMASTFLVSSIFIVHVSAAHLFDYEYKVHSIQYFLVLQEVFSSPQQVSCTPTLLGGVVELDCRGLGDRVLNLDQLCFNTSSLFHFSSSRSSSQSSYSSYSRDSRSRSRSKSFSRSGSRSRSRSRTPQPRRPRRPTRSLVPTTELTTPSYRANKKIPDTRLLGKGNKALPTSLILSEKKAANERALLMNPPAPSPRKKEVRPLSPGMMRKSAQNPPPPPHKNTSLVSCESSALDHVGPPKQCKGKLGSPQDNSCWCSIYKGKNALSLNVVSMRQKQVALVVTLQSRATRHRLAAGNLHLKLSGQKQQIKLTLKTPGLASVGPNTIPGVKKPTTGLPELPELNLVRRERAVPTTLAGKKRSAEEAPASDQIIAAKVAALSKPTAKKATSRREELLKQLKAVEDAIARKRSKI
uniref:Zinc finger CCCH domain-containing protein 18 n=1 Tax=Timema bartmani TaxID=61472 RepID=A0A7R9EY81_9NEOP|nr:unnamed protein product [Timema bartmani]